MSKSSRRAADRERECARVLGVERVKRARGESKPDVTLLTLTDEHQARACLAGTTIQAEVATRSRLPRLAVMKLAQAERYAPRPTIPLAVLSELGGAAIAVLHLRDLAKLLGLVDRTGEQIALSPRGEDAA